MPFKTVPIAAKNKQLLYIFAAVFVIIGIATLVFTRAATTDRGVNFDVSANTADVAGKVAFAADSAASGGSHAILNADEGTNPNPTKDTMYIDGRHLYSAAGEKVIFRGVNEMFIWLEQSKWELTMSEIAKSGSNVVRLVWDTNGSAADFDRLIQLTLDNKMIPYGELHGATGNIGGVPQMVDYWVRPEVVAVVQKHKQWFILNIANEAGGSNVPDDSFVNTNKTALTRIRDAGITVPIVIDGTQWAMNHEQIWRTWTQLRDHDPLHNVMFSLHSYWGGSDTQMKATYDGIADKITTDNIPVHVGEGPTAINSGCSPAPYEYLMQRLHENEIGWVTWSWGGADNQGCGPNSLFDLTTDGVFGHWEYPHAQTIVVDSPYSIQKTSVRPAGLR